MGHTVTSGQCKGGNRETNTTQRQKRTMPAPSFSLRCTQPHPRKWFDPSSTRKGHFEISKRTINSKHAPRTQQRHNHRSMTAMDPAAHPDWSLSRRERQRTNPPWLQGCAGGNSWPASAQHQYKTAQHFRARSGSKAKGDCEDEAMKRQPGLWCKENSVLSSVHSIKNIV